jgi:hypothetical protein
MPKITWLQVNQLRHSVSKSRDELRRIELNLRDYFCDKNDNVVHETVAKLVDFNADRLMVLLEDIDKIIQKNDGG